jgi:hypothetical protein
LYLLLETILTKFMSITFDAHDNIFRMQVLMNAAKELRRSAGGSGGRSLGCDCVGRHGLGSTLPFHTHPNQNLVESIGFWWIPPDSWLM